MRLPRLASPLGACVVFVAALAQAAALAWPGSGAPLWWLQLVSIGALYAVLDAVAGRQAVVDIDAPRTRVAARFASRPAVRGFFIGWGFATVWLTATFWWLFVSMHRYGGLSSPLAALAVLLLAASLSLYYAFASAAFVRFAPAHALARAGLFASLWLLAELLRGHWFTGFPWGAGGYAHVDGPLSFTAKYLGVYGVGALATLVAAVGVNLLAAPRERGRQLALLLLVPVAALVALGRGESTTDTGTLRVALLQGNIPQDEKFSGAGLPLALDWYARRLVSADADLVVAPETAIPLLPQYLPPGYWYAIAERYMTGQRAALIGVPLGSSEARYTNSAVGLAPGASPYQYDKHHLVPFGEFVPLFFRWFTDLMQIPLGDFGRGALPQPTFDWKGQRLAPNICYEDLFGEEIGAGFADSARAPTVLVNMSNIGWFGDTVAIDQHLAISRMRALEFERPMVRATNTGATVVIDHRGRVTAQLPRLTRDVLVGEVQGRQGVTAYAAWVSRVGLWPLWALGLLPVIGAALARRRERVAA